jgi:hypothetical protein
MNISIKYRSKPIDKCTIIYNVYGRSLGKKGFKYLYSCSTLEVAESHFKEFYNLCKDDKYMVIENDYIIKKRFVHLKEETVAKAPIRMLREQLPEIKGIF